MNHHKPFYIKNSSFAQSLGVCKMKRVTIIELVGGLKTFISSNLFYKWDRENAPKLRNAFLGHIQTTNDNVRLASSLHSCSFYAWQELRHSPREVSEDLNMGTGRNFCCRNLYLVSRIYNINYRLPKQGKAMLLNLVIMWLRSCDQYVNWL